MYDEISKWMKTVHLSNLGELEEHSFLLINNIHPRHDSISVDMITMNDVIAMMHSNTWGEKIKPDTRAYLSRILIECVQYLHSNYRKELYLEELSTEVGLSPFYLSRVFSKHIGMSPIILHKNVRLSHSLKELLLYPEYTITQISYAFNFYDVATFSNQFKKRFGASPSRIRGKFTGSDNLILCI